MLAENIWPRTEPRCVRHTTDTNIGILLTFSLDSSYPIALLQPVKDQLENMLVRVTWPIPLDRINDLPSVPASKFTRIDQQTGRLLTACLQTTSDWRADSALRTVENLGKVVFTYSLLGPIPGTVGW